VAAQGSSPRKRKRGSLCGRGWRDCAGCAGRGFHSAGDHRGRSRWGGELCVSRVGLSEGGGRDRLQLRLLIFHRTQLPRASPLSSPFPHPYPFIRSTLSPSAPEPSPPTPIFLAYPPRSALHAPPSSHLPPPRSPRSSQAPPAPRSRCLLVTTPTPPAKYRRARH
jgi:hypothetical protein